MEQTSKRVKSGTLIGGLKLLNERLVSDGALKFKNTCKTARLVQDGHTLRFQLKQTMKGHFRNLSRLLVPDLQGLDELNKLIIGHLLVNDKVGIRRLLEIVLLWEHKLPQHVKPKIDDALIIRVSLNQLDQVHKIEIITLKELEDASSLSEASLERPKHGTHHLFFKLLGLLRLF